jgi:hypothetical protein
LLLIVLEEERIDLVEINTISNFFNVAEYGAKGDGLTFDTVAIQAAVDDCVQKNGGTVYFPEGRYLTGTIKLGSNVTIYLSPAAVILGSRDIADYHVGVPSPVVPEISWISILFAMDAMNVNICGSGIINGQGEDFICGAEAFSVDEGERRNDGKPLLRPSLIFFKNCSSISLTEIKLEASAQFATLFENCKDLKFDRINIHNRSNQNTDGLHFFDCKDIFITECKLDCGDDAIVMNRSATRCVINSCIISSRWAGIRLGPFSTGTISNITVSNCVIHDTFGSAIKLQMVEGGVMENLKFDNIIMDNVTGPISIRLSHFSGWQIRRDTVLEPGTLRNITFSNITGNVAENARPLPHEVQPFSGECWSCINITGIPGSKVENVTFSNVQLTYAGGGTTEEAKRKDIPEMDFRYPEYYIFDTLPAYGLYARHVKGLILENVKFDTVQPDARYVLVCEDVENMDLSGVKARGDEERALIKLNDTKNVILNNCRNLNGDGILFESDDNDISQACSLK